MNADILLFFEPMPGALTLYEAIERWMLDRYPDIRISVKKTQISFFARFGFACVSLPLRRAKKRPGAYLILSFGLNREVSSPLIDQVAHPQPNRWTHHVLFTDEAMLDGELGQWLDEAYAFGNRP